MAHRRSIRTRRVRRNSKKEMHLLLTPLMDVLVIILVFLLKSQASSTSTFSTVPGIKIPMSRSEDIPPDSLQLIVTPEAMTFEDERILAFDYTGDVSKDEKIQYRFRLGDLDEGGRRVAPLYDALMKAREKSELLRTKSQARDDEGNPLPFDGVLAIQADKRISYDTLKKIMFTAASAGFKVFRFLALRLEE